MKAHEKTKSAQSASIEAIGALTQTNRLAI